jgi:serine/threonine-protein kinase mTOR
LLSNIGRQHPQALIYPLNVASLSPSAARKSAALTILDTMRQHSPEIVEQVRTIQWQRLFVLTMIGSNRWRGAFEGSHLMA